MKMRCVGVGDKKSLERFLAIGSYALCAAGIALSQEQRKKFASATVEIVRENGYLISIQVTE